MGYDVHITRKAASWADANDPAIITLAEWQAYVASDPEMQLDNYAEAPVYGTNDTIATESEGLSVWLPYSGNGVKDNYAWFDFQEDRVTVKNPDEEILGKMLAIARVLQARVQGDDGEYFDEADLAGSPHRAAGRPIGNAADFRDFQTFASAEAAQPLLQALAAQGLDYLTEVDNGQVAFDPSFANNQLTSKFVVKLQLADFERGSQLLASLNQDALRRVAPDHYLFSFSDEELFDLLMKPDEWSALDVALAGQLLQQRGRDISPDTMRLLRQHRVAELAQPDKDHKYLIISGYVSALLGGVFAMLIGYQLYFDRKQLPDGRRVHSYSPTDRVHGLRILVLGISVFLLVLTARLIGLGD